MKKGGLTTFILLLWQITFAQSGISAVHYDTEDGLPQKTVMNIVQDRQGFMWFSTWDGICKFDGVNFYTYKVRKEDSPNMRSDRFDGMWLDKFGYIWVNTYEGEIYRFDPRTERFRGLRSSKELGKLDFITHGITRNPSGKRWVLNPKLGCICFRDTAFLPVLFNKSNHLIGNNHVNKVFEDTRGNSWLLTDAGIHVFSPGLKSINQYYTGKTGTAHGFYSAIQIGNDILLGSDSGMMYRYAMASGRMSTLPTCGAASIKYIQPISAAQTFIAAADDHFFIFDHQTQKLQSYSISGFRPGANVHINYCYADRAANIWIKTDEAGISRFSIRSRQFKYYNPKVPAGPKDPTTPRFYIWEDKNNRLWIQPGEAGLQLYDPAIDELKSFRAPAFSNHAQSVILHSGYSDRQGNLWLSTRSNGINKVLFGDAGLKTQIVDPDTSALLNNDIRSIMQDHRGRLWVGTKGGKVFVYDSGIHQQGYLCTDGRIGHGLPVDGRAYTITEDASHRIWIGCKGNGVYKLVPNADSASFRISHYQNSKADPYSLSDDRVYSIFVDQNQRVWVGTYGGGLNLLDDKADGRFFNYRNDFKDYPIASAYRIRSIAGDNYGNLYIGTPMGLFATRPNYSDLAHLKLEHFERSPTAGSIGGNDIYDIATTKKGETYISCFGGGLTKVASRRSNGLPSSFITYTTQNGLPSNLVQQIEEDNKGKLWLSAESSVSRFDPITGTFQSYSDVPRLLRGEVISEGGAAHTNGGHILFGCSAGIVIIDPSKLSPLPFTPYVAFTAFRIANRDVPVSDSTVLPKNVDYLQHIRLNYRQNFISIEFAALDFKNTQQLNYAYRLDGIDNGWVNTKQGDASYSNLSPGTYVFRVRSTNSYGTWGNNERRLMIEIVPAFWQTVWAWILYLIAAASLTFFGLRWVYQYFRLKDRLQLEHEQAEMKANFFTEISHEIRTPLTMIVSPVEHMLEKGKFEPAVTEHLKLIHKNAARMLRLVNQVLDLRKMESQLLIVCEVEAGAVLSDVASGFLPMANVNNITLKMDDRTQGTGVWLDKDGFEKIIYNLVSNAIKSTSAGDTITVESYLEQGKFVVRVADSGRGMSAELLQKLFSRFISYNPNKNQPGTGLGLSIVKQIADRHHANVSVESSEKTGSTFTVVFEPGTAHFKDDPNVLILNRDPHVSAPDIAPLVNDEADESIVKEQNTILVIEDDEDLRRYITGILRTDYNVIEAGSGSEGMDKALAETPDFILSDIMMPGTDGLSFLKQLRDNTATSHIPLIFLTARADQETELKAYDFGAEAFMTKPFSTRVLQSRIKTIIGQRRRLYQGMVPLRNGNGNTTAGTATTEKPPKLTRIDEQFIKKIRSEIEKHIAESEYTVEELIAALPMSRTVFVKKLKSITGYSPIEFMRFVKIQYAAKLLGTKNYSIKEVSNMVGIADTKYFSHRFKEIIGMMPSEYKATVKN
ncbi:response regulator [Mucilaginibacter mali]|uniref:histidine kinase n=1 Tax=Mucilaginibacter mali TaxID=2740462 RepID=A0A7D4UFQ9_9SPHI|nr:two-component regulator propeller domain-containing protein [Mucilaginibacter mali]QKJ30716.1 response regulator [Mucilaginibacter mali]